MARRQSDIPTAFDLFSQPSEPLAKRNRRSSILKPMDLNDLPKEDKRQSKRISFAKNVFCQELLPDGTTQVVTEAFLAHEEDISKDTTKEDASDMNDHSDQENSNSPAVHEKTMIMSCAMEETFLSISVEVTTDLVVEYPSQDDASGLEASVEEKASENAISVTEMIDRGTTQLITVPEKTTVITCPMEETNLNTISPDRSPEMARRAIVASPLNLPTQRKIVGRSLLMHNRLPGMRKSLGLDMHEAFRKKIQELVKQAEEECLSDMSGMESPVKAPSKPQRSDISLEQFTSQESQPRSPEKMTNFINLPMEVEREVELDDNRESVAMSIDESLSQTSPTRPESGHGKTMVNEKSMDETCDGSTLEVAPLSKTIVQDKTMDFTFGRHNFTAKSVCDKSMEITMGVKYEDQDDDEDDMSDEEEEEPEKQEEEIENQEEVPEKQEEPVAEDSVKNSVNSIREVSRDDVQDLLDSVLSSQEKMHTEGQTTTQLVPLMSQHSIAFEKTQHDVELEESKVADMTSRVTSLVSETSSTSSMVDYPDESIFEKTFNVTMAQDDDDSADESIYDFGKAADTSACFSLVASDETFYVAEVDQTLALIADELDKKMEDMTDFMFNRTVRLSDAAGDNLFPALYSSLSGFNAKNYQATYTSLEEDSATINFLMDTLAVVIEFGPTVRTFNGIPIKPLKVVKLESSIGLDKQLDACNSVHAIRFTDEDKPILKAGHDLVTNWFAETKQSLLAKYPTSDSLNELLEEFAQPMIRASSMVCELKTLDMCCPMTFVGKNEDTYEFEFVICGISRHISILLPITPKTYPFENIRPRLCTHVDDRGLYNASAFSLAISNTSPGPRYAYRLLKGSKIFVKCQKKYNLNQAKARKRKQIALKLDEAKRVRMMND
ncbi:hypothetical protein HDE_00244 [Halotydeus destructor]|nr:hypothetical protein HDE_00244 [Halotydeus destructor]